MCKMKLLGFNSVDFDLINQLLNRYSTFIRNLREYGTVLQLIDFKKAHYSVQRIVLYNIFINSEDPWN
jgi:hypothetical protein